MRVPQDQWTDADSLLRVAVIASIDLAVARCTVELEDGVESPPLPWLAPRMGEIKAWIAPSVGEQVLLLCPAGEISAGLVLGGICSSANPAPIDEPLALIKFSDGAGISYDPVSSELLFDLPAGATTVLKSDAGIDIIGDVSIEGDVTATGTITSETDVIAGGIKLKTHKHIGVQSGGAQTGNPV